jgi:hypothetical protein
MTITLTFDTLKFANRLKEAGVPEKQAEAQTGAIAEVMAEAIKTSDWASKADLKEGLHETELRIIKWVIGLALAQIGLLVGVFIKIVG